MKAMYANRLLKLAAFLDKLPKAKFNFGTFTSLGGKPMMEALKAGRSRCGTTACAVGWMPAVFPRTACWIGKDQPYGHVIVGLRSDKGRRPRLTNFDVAERFFGLSYDETRNLFDPGSEFASDDAPGWTATPKEVAKHIRRFVRQKQKAAAK
jgi:hypothetical protein